MSDEPEETAYYLRLVSMYMDLGTETVLDVFVYHSPRNDPETFLKSKEETLVKLKTDRILNKQECELLLEEHQTTDKHKVKYIVKSTVDIKSFDISLIITLSINLFTEQQLQPPKKGWDNPPRNNDKSIAADLLRLRTIRNVIVGHHSNARLPKWRFDEEWENVSEILLRLQQHTTHGNEAIVKEKIEAYRLQIHVSPLENKYDEKLNGWQEEVSKAQDQVEDLLKKLEGFDAYFKHRCDRYERYTKLLIEGGRFVLSSFLDKQVKKQGKDIRSILDENKDTLERGIADSKHLDILFPPETTSPIDMSSWNVSLLATVILQLFYKFIDDATIWEIEKIDEAFKNSAENALAALDSNTFEDYSTDLKASLLIVSGKLDKDQADQYKQIVVNSKRKIAVGEFQTYMDELTQGKQMKKMTDIFQETLQKTKDCLRDMITCGVPFKRSHDLELKMITLGNDEEKKITAEEILTEVWLEALDRSPQTADFASVKKEVEKILKEIRKLKCVKNITIKTACIILQISLTSPSDMLNIMSYFESTEFHEALVNISKELGYYINTALSVYSVIPIECLMGIINCQSDPAQQEESGIRLPITVSSPAGMLQLRSLFNSEKIANSTNAISDALSKYLDETITLNVCPDMKVFSSVFDEDKASSDSCSDSSSSESTLTSSTRLKQFDEPGESLEERSNKNINEVSTEDKTAGTPMKYTGRKNAMTESVGKTETDSNIRQGENDASISADASEGFDNSIRKSETNLGMADLDRLQSSKYTELANSSDSDESPTDFEFEEKKAASSSGGNKMKKNIRYSRMKQPPLIKQLKGVLSEYPDGGQILMELIQNAEDAGAREVKILHDNRKINHPESKGSETMPFYTKFFKGPAICVYNDAVFTEKDWDGIQMIYSSIKEEDPMTVGRFGLGFKSVFHITDFPCVISGDRVLLIDPQQSTEKVNATLDLCAIEDYIEEGLDAAAFWSALDNTFGLCRSTLGEDGFRGTLFWFPLRENTSDLSETLYNETKVENLFNSFTSEASNILLFLKNIEKMSLHFRDAKETVKEILNIEIADKDGTVKQTRNAFKECIADKNSTPESADIHSTVQMIIHTSTLDTNKSQEWLVVNYFARQSASEGFRYLIQDRHLGYSPYVGVATPLNGLSDEFEGHVFCFRPLPREGEQLTGLPVHVNGFFALSQNRHHMKWETEEQEGTQIDDKSILWNKALISEALPKAYELLVLEAIKLAEKNLNDDAFVTAVYNAMPVCTSSPRKTHKRWMMLENKLYENLEKRNIAYATHTNEWIALNKAFFATFRTLPGIEIDTSMQEAVTKCLYKIGLKYTKLPIPLFDTMKMHFPYIKDLTPGSLVNHLQQRREYREMTCNEKIQVLAYLLLEEGNVVNIKGLELLPLASGRWTAFSKESDPVYFCTDAAVKMFPGLEDKLVMESRKLGGPLSENIASICKSETYQIQRLSVDCAKTLLTQTLIHHVGSDTYVRLTKESSLTSQWLENVWHVLIEKNMVKHFKDIPLVPVLIQGSWTDPHIIELVRLSDIMIVKESEDSVLADGLCSCLHAMKVKVLASLPGWIPFEFIQEFVYRPTKEGIVSLLAAVYKRTGDAAVSEFNTVSQVNNQINEALNQFASTLSYIETDVANLLRKLSLFRAVRFIDEQGQYKSVTDVPRYISEDMNFPPGVEFPYICIKLCKSEDNLIKQLEAENISTESLVLSTIQNLMLHKKHDQISIFMNYFIEHFNLFETNTTICENAAQLPFLEVGTELHKPSELFDPSSPSVQRLLLGESLFPESSRKFSNEEIRALQRLGLKGKDKIDASVMLQVANTLSIWSKDDQKSHDLSIKASEFMEILVHHPDLLDTICNGASTLGNALISVSCIPVVQNTPVDYPEGLPWFSKDVNICKPSEAKLVEWGLLVGATVPMVDCASDNIVHTFKWNVAPKIHTVLQQLAFIRQHYNVKNKPDYMRAVQRIYKYLNQFQEDVSNLQNILATDAVIWNGTGFELPGKVIITKREQDLDLNPYFCNLPEEIRDMDDLFLQLGCHPEQNNEILISVLQSIKLKYESSSESSECSVSRDLSIVLAILKVLASRRKEGSFKIDDSKMLILVENQSSEKLCLQYVSDCIFDDDQYELDQDEEKNYYVVNENVAVSVAEDLGVKSVKKKTILGATEEFSFEEWGQHESLTTRISTLLRDGYKDGLSVPKELVQNADDAGATVIKFLYDERPNNDAKRKEKLLSSDLRECQGPALWVYNDSQFTESDLQNITKLNGATKADDQDKIGKFGLGFCSVYNLTDVPSFISGKDMVIFDPHEKYLEEARQKRGTGLRVRLSKRNLIRRNVDQFKPYSAVFGCKILDETFTDFSGTLFRLPLRTTNQAVKSEICKEAYTKEEVSVLLNKLVENAGNILLFTQNVKTLEIYFLSKDETDPSHAKLLFSVDKKIGQFSRDKTTRHAQSILKRIPTILKNNEDFTEIQRVEITQTLYENSFLTRKSGMTNSFETNWILSWALGKNECLRLSKRISDKGAVPLSAVAVLMRNKHNTMPLMLKDSPYGFYREGHLFCFLPLPIRTSLPVHVNGCFSVTSDRRSLSGLTEDDKRKGDNNIWNQTLMEDPLVLSYVQLLLFLSTLCADSYSYHSLWPLGESDDIQVFKQSFYRTLILDKPKLFRGITDWLSADEVVYLDPSIRCNTQIGDTAFEFLSSVPVRQGKKIVELPSHVLESFQVCKCDSKSTFIDAMISEEELIIHFLSTLSSEFWKSESDKRNRVILYSLKCNSKKVFTKLQNTQCIPSHPNDVLCKPNELINPRSEIADMFDDVDGRFPSKDGFNDAVVIAQLISLGMNDKYLPNEMLIQRCKSIEALLRVCGSCAQERCVKVLKYCGQWEVMQNLEADTDSINRLKYTLLIPVLPSPTNWKFAWRGDSLKEHTSSAKCVKHQNEIDKCVSFGKPVNLFRESFCNCIGSVSSFVHEQYLRKTYPVQERLFKALDVKRQLTVDLLLEQLILLSHQYTDSEQQFSNLDAISKSVYEGLARLTGDKSEEEISKMQCFLNLKEQPIIVIGKELVMPCKVAFKVKAECPPELYCLREVDYNRRKVFKALGVVEHFSVGYLISILKRLYTLWYQRVCTDIETVTCLLQTLCESMKVENITYEDLTDSKVSIVAPDSGGFLRPTNELVIEDPAYKTSATLHILHGQISPDTGRALGVKSKQRRIVECFSSGFFMPFGQNESLVTRLTGILEDYPCDSSIMKELMQNADDAGATEIHFVKNYATHSSAKIFGRRELQGPALCVFNNSYFTEEDFNGIRNLGIGSKQEDPSKTGQYGIGFNAVYHLTDVPSFLTKGPGLGNCGQICIFDPLMTHLEGHITRETPGIKCDVELMEESFPDMLRGYPTSLMEQAGQGTMFRLPLRQGRSDISKNVVSVGEMDKLLEECKHDMFECLLFLKNVKCIKVSNCSNGNLTEEYAVETELSEEDALSRQSFFSDVKEIVQKNLHSRHDNFCVQPLEASYKLIITDTSGRNENWFIVNRFGTEHVGAKYESLLSAFKDKTLGLLPFASVALHLPQNEWKERFERNVSERYGGYRKPKPRKAFCFLPLPVITGLPLHVNGHFALDKPRSKLWNEGIRKCWNEFVIGELITRAWISAMQFLKVYLLCHYTERKPDRLVCSEILETYHKHFPLWNRGVDEFWKWLVGNFYRIVIENKTTIFPSTHISLVSDLSTVDQSQGAEELDVRWVSLSVSENDLSGTFNGIMKEAPGPHYDNHRFSREDGVAVENALKKMGMKIIETPMTIYSSITQSDIEYVPMCCPASVLKFLKTYEEADENSCKLGGIDIVLSDTTISDLGIIESLIKFLVLDEQFHENVNGLPLCVTNDGVLRTFKGDKKLYCSEMCDVLTGSADRFVHSKCVSLVDREEFYKGGVIKCFAVDDFVSLIADTFDKNKLANGHHIIWDKEHGVPLTSEIIQHIYKFIYMNSLDNTSYVTTVNQQLFSEHVRKLNDWALLPSYARYGSQTTYELVPVCQTCHLIYIGYGSDSMYKILSKLNILTLDISVFSGGWMKITSPLQEMLPSTAQPLQLLDCLLHYKMKLQSSSLTVEDGLTLLSYFDRNIDTLRKQTDVHILRYKLKQLPLFVAHQGEVTSIEKYQDVIVLPQGIPAHGIDVWAELTGILLLVKTDRLLKLYDLLQLPRMGELDVYVDKVLPNIQKLPRESWMIHIEYIKINLLTPTHELSNKQRQLVRQLENISFVRVSGKNKRVNQLYDCNNPVFATMLTADNFLPVEYRRYSWSYFMDLLGLIKEPTAEMLINFALEVERNIRCSISERIRKQSDALIECVFNGEWSTDTLHRIKGIRFVTPYTVDRERKSVCKQPGNGEELICFSGAVFWENEDYCWSNANLLPCIPFSAEIGNALGIHAFPPIDEIVKHCQNVCDVFHTLLERNCVRQGFVKFLMEKLYKILAKSYKPTMQRSFQVTPIVFHPEGKMLPVKEIVINLTEDEEVKPYLYKLPNCFGAYEDLFVKLGSHRHVICSHYSNVLESIKQQYRDGPIPPNVLVCVKMALENIVRLLDKEPEPFKNVTKLYIPDRNQCLVDSRSLTVSNNIDIEERLDGKLDLNFFIGFREIDIRSVSDPELPFLQCPEHLRPNILTDVVTEEISTNDIIQEESIIAQRIEGFIRSPYVVEGILRLVKHQMKLHRKPFERRIEKIFMLRLTHVRMTKVTGLKTFLKYNGVKVGGTDRDTSCFIKSRTISHPDGNEITENELIFQVDVADDILIHLIEEQSGLVKLIDLCTDGVLEKELSQHLTSILRMQENSSKIKQKLDKLRIAAYDLPASFAVSIFPRAGTYVEEKFHPFLEQSIVPFKMHEFMYVAVEVENDDDNGDLVYIYAHIICENRRKQGDSILQITYCIDVGYHNDEYITVPLHRLYKFKPQQPEEVNALVVYDIEPIGSVPIDENFRRARQMLIEAWSLDEKDRKRVIRRLLHRWHPDRNVDHREYAERLFNYVNEVIIKLEHNEIIEDAITHETGRMSPDMSQSSFGSASSAAYSRGCRYAAAFRNNMRDYNRSTRTGNYVHYKAEDAVVRHIGEAKRWHRQAVQDFIAAESNVSSAQQDRSFNWVCYKCHQASEKALKSAWFAKNANRATKREHSLTTIANGLDDGSLLNEASSLEGITGNYSCMRYPDAVAGIHHIPSEMFDRTKAEKALEVTKCILDMAADFIN